VWFSPENFRTENVSPVRYRLGQKSKIVFILFLNLNDIGRSGQKSEIRNQKSEIVNQKSKI
jgi:hypothetical protein